MKTEWPYEFPGAYWLDEQEEQAVLDVLRSGSLFRYYGLHEPHYVDRLEEAACEFYGTRHALAINSGTGALITAMLALGIGPGCEVLVPAYMWVATVGAVVQCDAIPVLCEVDDTFSLSPQDLEKKITPRTKLIVAIHMAGSPADMAAILAVADKHGIPVLEDAAQCNGGTFRGRKAGTLGKMGIFSLQLNKNMTCGEGGLLITDDEALFDRAFSAHDMGMVRVEGRLAMPAPEAVMWGAGRRMPELSGAVAYTQIKKLPQILAHMRASNRRMRAQLEGTPGLTLRRLNDAEGDTGPFLLISLEDEARAVRAVERMKAAGLHNVVRIAEAGLHIYYNLPALVGKVPLSPAGNPWSLAENAQSVYHYTQGTCPESDALFARSVLIPVPSRLTEEQETEAVEIIQTAVKN